MRDAGMKNMDGTHGTSKQDLAACVAAGNQPSRLWGFGEWRHAAVMSRTAKTPVATIADFRGVTSWLWVICARCQYRHQLHLRPRSSGGRQGLEPVDVNQARAPRILSEVQMLRRQLGSDAGPVVQIGVRVRYKTRRSRKDAHLHLLCAEGCEHLCQSRSRTWAHGPETVRERVTGYGCLAAYCSTSRSSQ